MGHNRFIAQVCPCYVDLDRETGGVANIVRQLCLHLSRQGQPVVLLCGNREFRELKAKPGIRSINDYLSIEIFEQRPHPLMGPSAALTSRLLSMPQTCVAHVHTCFSAFAETAMTSCRLRGIPFVFTPHGKLSRHSFGSDNWAKQIWWTMRSRKAIQHATAIAVSSHEEASRIEGLQFTQPCHVIPNGYALPDENRAGDRIIREPYILFLGYLDPRKQPEFLVTAFAKSTAASSHRLVIAGPDTYGHQDFIQQTARDLAILEKVVFYGSVHGQTKWNLLRYAACLCLPSLGEGLPLVLCEALGAGIPSIFSRECNFQELAMHGAGMMLEEFVPALWAEAIDRVCLDASARQSMTEAARSLQRQYSWESIVARWSTLYDSLSAVPTHSLSTNRQAYG